MKKNIPIIIVIVLAVLLIGVGVILTTNNDTKKSTPPTAENYKLEEYGTITTCYNEDCSAFAGDNYAKITYDYDSKKLQDAIDKINKETEENYSEAKNSTTNDSSCELIKDYNENSIRYSNQYNVYTNDKVVSIAVSRTKINVCTNEYNPRQTEVYIYDFINDKILTLEETMNLLDITYNDIHEDIYATNKELSQLEKVEITTKDKYDDVVLYYNSVGTLFASYYIEELNVYYSASITKVNQQ